MRVNPCRYRSSLNLLRYQPISKGMEKNKHIKVKNRVK